MKRSLGLSLGMAATLGACAKPPVSPKFLQASGNDLPQSQTVDPGDGPSGPNTANVGSSPTLGTAPGSTPGPTSSVGPAPGTNPGPNTIPPVSGKPGGVIGAYFVEWGVYGRTYEIDNIPWNKINHLIYAFVPICGNQDSLKAANPTGWDTLQKECVGKQKFDITIHDTFAALAAPHNTYAKLAAQKKLFPNVKILPSIGGWTLSDGFFEMASTPTNRAIFIKSCIKFLQTYDFFDGIDIDWEYPGGKGASATLGSAADKANHLALMTELRAALDTLGAAKKRAYMITSAVGAGPANIGNVDYKSLYANPSHPLIDLIFAMTYDYYGAWSGLRSHQAALYPRDVALSPGFSASETMSNMMTAGVPASHLVMGVASYGRAWQGVTSPTPLSSSLSDLSGTAFAMETGMWEAGILDYKFIVTKFKGATGWTNTYDKKAKAPYLWSASLKKLISYEDTCSVQAKVDYAAEKGLAGTFMWELDSDNGDLMNVMSGAKATGCE
ncbi:MAG: glycoside hydrolase family 18 protein [Chitinophagaceae bacterium]|nr:glycoside hydrolase family 18 protein [Oligoflexus sp.]